MAAPVTKEGALQQLRVLWFVWVVTIALYVWVGEMVSGIPWLDFPNARTVFTLVGIASLVGFVWFRQRKYSESLEALRSQPDDIHAIRRWINSWLVLACVAEIEAVFGLVMRLGGHALQQSLPFYVVGLLLTLWMWPQLARSSPQ